MGLEVALVWNAWRDILSRHSPIELPVVTEIFCLCHFHVLGNTEDVVKGLRSQSLLFYLIRVKLDLYCLCPSVAISDSTAPSCAL